MANDALLITSTICSCLAVAEGFHPAASDSFWNMPKIFTRPKTMFRRNPKGPLIAIDG